MLKLLATTALATLLACAPTHAASITMLPHQLDDIGTAMISGELTWGDDTRLARLIAFHDVGRIVINSGGGDVNVSHAIAELVRQLRITILVLQHNPLRIGMFHNPGCKPYQVRVYKLRHWRAPRACWLSRRYADG